MSSSIEPIGEESGKMEPMVQFVLRTLWRLVVLGVGIGLAYLVVFVLFPYLDQRLPIFFALLVAYIALAYFALPAVLRTWRLFIRPDHIPLYVTTRDGIPSDPVNIAVVTRSRHHYIKVMKKAGWAGADKENLRNSIRAGWAMAWNKPYSTAPLSSLFLFNRPFDVGFQIVYGKNGSPRHRHHVRFWQLIDKRQDHGHFRFWARHFRRFIGREKTIWIGAATDDNSVYGIRWFNLQPTHRSHPEPQRERDLIIESLQKAGYVQSVSEVQAGQPFRMKAQSIGNNFICDGKLKIVELK
jgi:hypothetical protein